MGAASNMLFNRSKLERKIAWILVCGGLGNQMFQVAHALALSRRFNLELRFVDVTSRGRIPRVWELTCFGIRRYPLTSFQQGGILARVLLAQKLRRLAHSFGLADVLLETKESVDFAALSCAPSIVSGYWQGELFFVSVQQEVRALFRFPDTSHSKPAAHGKASAPVVAIHVRRGDYVSDPVARNYHLVCDVDYYRAAWRRMQADIGNCSALVFSDDLKWARSELALEGNVAYAESSPDAPAWFDLARMSQCQHFVTSNSSYSWWAAYLSSSPNKQVIAPKDWFRGVDTRKLQIFQKSWILL